MLGHLAVQRGAAVRAYSQVQRLAHQIVCECAGHHHTRGGRFDEERLDLGLGHAGDSRKDADVWRTHHGGHLKQLERLLGQPGEPTLEDLPHAGRDRPGRRAAARLEARNLGGEKRVAAAAPVHLGDVILARFGTDNAAHQSGGSILVETGQWETPYSG